MCITEVVYLSKNVTHQNKAFTYAVFKIWLCVLLQNHVLWLHSESLSSVALARNQGCYKHPERKNESVPHSSLCALSMQYTVPRLVFLPLPLS